MVILCSKKLTSIKIMFHVYMDNAHRKARKCNTKQHTEMKKKTMNKHTSKERKNLNKINEKKNK